jgi:hypothetical protein
VVVRRPTARTLGTGAALLVALGAAGCGPASDAPPQVRVVVGGQAVELSATQYCADGEGHRYTLTPPVIEAAPDSQITFTVPDAVAREGWSVQVFDEHLKQPIGNVRVAAGKAVFNGISTSDVVPAAFYLVVVEDKIARCHNLSGAWPVGIIRAAQGATPTTTSMPATG